MERVRHFLECRLDNQPCVPVVLSDLRLEIFYDRQDNQVGCYQPVMRFPDMIQRVQDSVLPLGLVDDIDCCFDHSYCNFFLYHICIASLH